MSPPPSLLLSADITKGFPALETAEGTLVALLLPVESQQQQPHPSTTLPDPAIEAAAAAGTASSDAAAAAEQDEEDQLERLSLPKGTIAARLPLMGLVFISGVPPGDYKIAILKARCRKGSIYPLRGSKVYLCVSS